MASPRLLIASLVLTGCGVEDPQVGRDRVASGLLEHAGVTPFSGPMEAAASRSATLDEAAAVARALQRSPSFQLSLAELGVAHADLVQAGQIANPLFSILFPLGPKQLEFTATVPLDALWLRPRRVAIAELEAERVAHALVQDGLDRIRDVRCGFADLALAAEQVRMTADLAALAQRNAALARSGLEAGEIAADEAAPALVAAAAAVEQAAQAESRRDRAEQDLRLLVGADGTATSFVLARGVPRRRGPQDESALLARALVARPDLRAAELAIESAGRRAGLAEAEAFGLSAVLDANGAGKKGFEMGPGLALPLPILARNPGGIARADAELGKAVLRYHVLSERIAHQVHLALRRLADAESAVARWQRDALPAARAGVAAAEASFRDGAASEAPLLAARTELLRAELRLVALLAEQRCACAELERAVGARLFEREDRT